MTAEAVAKFHRLNERRQQLQAALRDVSDRWSTAHAKMRTAKDALIQGNFDPVTRWRYKEKGTEGEELAALTEQRQVEYDKLKAVSDRLLIERDAVQERTATLNAIVQACDEELRSRNIRVADYRTANAPAQPGPGAGIFAGGA